MARMAHLHGRRRTRCIHALIVCAAASALLVARSAAPVFRSHSSVSAVSSNAHHDKRPRFVDNAPQFLPPAVLFAISPPQQPQARLAPLASLAVSFPAHGIHYNRPPPIL
jgi:hypothetical protein